MNNLDLERALSAAVAREREASALVLRLLREVEGRELYLERGYSSLFAYCRGRLGYTEPEAMLRIQAMRLMRRVPEVEKKIERGELSLSVASLGAGEDEEAGGKRGQGSGERNRGKEQKGGPWRGCFQFPVSRRGAPLRSGTETVLSPLPELAQRIGQVTRYIPRKTRRHVWKRDNARCQHQDPQTKHKCQETHGLQIDHKQPYSEGGTHHPGNLRLLCGAHNRYRNSS